METVELNAQIFGDGPPLVILHGLFGSGRNWGSIARALGESRQVHCLDLRNHGNSPWTSRMDYPSMAADVARYMETRGLAPADLLGHSMGGKTAMTLALSVPELIERLIVVDIAPVTYVRDHFSGFLNAMRSLDFASLTRRGDIDAALAPAISDASMRAFLMQNLVSQDGRFQWRVNLEGIGPSLPSIIGFPPFDNRFEGPATFLAGEKSDYIRPRDEAAISGLFPHSRLIEIGGAGHWPHAEQPARFVQLVGQALEIDGTNP